jgi:transposase
VGTCQGHAARTTRQGVTAKDNRLFIDTLLWIARTRARWRDLPVRFGPWNSVWRRFDRWSKRGVWERSMTELADPVREERAAFEQMISADSCD